MHWLPLPAAAQLACQNDLPACPACPLACASLPLYVQCAGLPNTDALLDELAAEGALPVSQLGEEQRRRRLLAHLCGMALANGGAVDKYVFEVVGQRIWGAWNGGK